MAKHLNLRNFCATLTFDTYIKWQRWQGVDPQGGGREVDGGVTAPRSRLGEAMNSFICLLAQVATSFCKHFRLHATFFVHPKNPKNSKLERGHGQGGGREGVPLRLCKAAHKLHIPLHTGDRWRTKTRPLSLSLCSLSLSFPSLVPFEFVLSCCCCCCFTASLGRFSGKVSCFTFSLWLSWFYLQLNKTSSTVLNANSHRCMRFAAIPSGKRQAASAAPRPLSANETCKWLCALLA